MLNDLARAMKALEEKKHGQKQQKQGSRRGTGPRKGKQRQQQVEAGN